MPFKGLAFIALLLPLTTYNPKPKNELYTGSTAILLVVNNVIYIASDSKQIQLTEGYNGIKYSGKDCKIHQNGQLIYTSLGMIKEFNPDVDIVRIISRLDLSKCESLKEKIDKIEKSIYDSATLIAASIQKYHRQYFYEHVLNKSLIDIGFGTFENGKSAIGYLLMFCKIDKRQRVHLQDSISVNHDNSTILAMGHREFYDSVSKDSNYTKQFRSIEDYIHALIKGQSIKTPELVNDTSDIIVLGANGRIAWLEKHQECD